jgi:hypothetical protein
MKTTTECTTSAVSFHLAAPGSCLLSCVSLWLQPFDCPALSPGEKGYDPQFFHYRVERVFIDDHNVPSLE